MSYPSGEGAGGADLPASETRSIHVAVLSPNRLDRDCTVAELSMADGLQAEACEELPIADGKPTPDLVVLQDPFSPRDTSWLASQLDIIVAHCADIATVVLGDLTESALRLCLDAKVRAHLPADATPAQVACAIRMSYSGMLIYPASLLHRIVGEWAILREARGNGAQRRTIHLAGSADLTARQGDVVRLLAAGLPNKDIARNLAISESTVKVHLRAIMRRIGVSRRADIVAHYTDVQRHAPIKP